MREGGRFINPTFKNVTKMCLSAIFPLKQCIQNLWLFKKPKSVGVFDLKISFRYSSGFRSLFLHSAYCDFLRYSFILRNSTRWYFCKREILLRLKARYFRDSTQKYFTIRSLNKLGFFPYNFSNRCWKCFLKINMV